MKVNFGILGMMLMNLIFSQAQSGYLDPSFGNGGWVNTDFGGKDQSGCVAVQPDGKLLVGGRSNAFSGSFDFIVVRYLENGQLDLSFGDQGKVVLDFGSTQENVEFIHYLPENKILIGGYSNLSPNTRSYVVRLFEDGRIDSSFANQGVLSFKYGRSTGILNMDLQEDGKYVFGCIGVIDTLDVDFLVTRFHPDGQIDTSFNHTGWTYYDFMTRENIPFDMFVQKDHKIFLSGCSGVYPKANFAFVRYNEDGSLDSSFGTNGSAQTDFAGNQDVAYSSIIQEDGSFYTSGTVRDSITNYDFALAKYNPDGSLDQRFGINGKRTYDFKGPVDFGLYMKQQKDGKLLVCGENNVLTKNSFVVVRFDKEGTIDPTFGVNGIAALDVVNILTDDTPSFTLQQDEKIVMVGNYKDGTNINFLVMRFLNDDISASHEGIFNLLRIAPNPIDEKLILHNSSGDTKYNIAIVHPNGSILQQNTIQFDHEYYELQLSNVKSMVPGVYFLKWENDKKRGVLPFVKK